MWHGHAGAQDAGLVIPHFEGRGWPWPKSYSFACWLKARAPRTLSKCRTCSPRAQWDYPPAQPGERHLLSLLTAAGQGVEITLEHTR
jgi:hypothetical protein